MAYKINDDCIACGACADECPVGCIAEEQIVGKMVFRAWPLDSIGVIH